jgi:hypothetical protein
MRVKVLEVKVKEHRLDILSGKQCIAVEDSRLMVWLILGRPILLQSMMN